MFFGWGCSRFGFAVVFKDCFVVRLPGLLGCLIIMLFGFTLGDCVLVWFLLDWWVWRLA